jgi:hypothetical protein
MDLKANGMDDINIKKGDFLMKEIHDDLSQEMKLIVIVAIAFLVLTVAAEIISLLLNFIAPISLIPSLGGFFLITERAYKIRKKILKENINHSYVL